MIPLLSAKDSLSVKCNQNALASNPMRSSITVTVCDFRTVPDCALDYHPLFSKKMLESWHILPKVSCRHYSQPCHKAPGHLHAQPVCALPAFPLAGNYPCVLCSNLCLFAAVVLYLQSYTFVGAKI